ncbi:uncharacterized protein LOC131650041 [Vicia villosa]|uniref:uncharacterized protein LOC131650041 n=1 Tax=Vicia villosa TaxID=3911 RepID=UPI00273BCFA6|nr:uncharacterized protein LOC131650041 [Vicia villosa]
MSVLVNGSPTKEFVVDKGLRQGDPLSPFLSVLVTEGLTSLVNQSIAAGEFEPFSINRGCKMDILQFADDTLLARYGDISVKVLGGDSALVGIKKGSTWWRDLLKIGCKVGKDPFASFCTFIPKIGYKTPFWEAKWMSDKNFKEEFPLSYDASSLKGISVAGMRGWEEGCWKWGDLGVSDEAAGNVELNADLESLRDLLATFVGWGEGGDVVEWEANREDGFTVASCYGRYASLQTYFGPPCKFDEVEGIVWKAGAPFKIKAFAWRLIATRLPTKDILLRRGIPFSFDNLKCSFCGLQSERRDHSFFACFLVKNIWLEIALWIGKEVIEKDECLSSFMD